jgi:hypothetical protein
MKVFFLGFRVLLTIGLSASLCRGNKGTEQ